MVFYSSVGDDCDISCLLFIKPGGPRGPGFLKSFRPWTLVYVRVCVSAPEAINNKSRERHA